MCIVKKIATQALQTFKNKESSLFPTQFERLLSLIENLKENEVGLDQEIKKQKSDAPVTFINIYEGSIFTLGIFIIRKGKSIPLHDHPGMIGVCKVLHGSLLLQSYQKMDTPTHHSQLYGTRNLLTVKRLPEKILNCEDFGKCEVLTPVFGNYHSVSAIQEDAIMFDVLTPPYTTGRDCSYYEEVPFKDQAAYGFEPTEAEKQNGLTLLKEISPPSSFFCDSEVYKGPKIDIEEDS